MLNNSFSSPFVKFLLEKEVHETIRKFLYEWGGMARFLEQRKDWEKELVDLVRQESELLEKFKKTALDKVVLFDDEVNELYKKFRQVLGKVASAKVMHLICPDFFPIWDNNIEKAVKRAAKFRGEDYYRFIYVELRLSI